MKKLMYLLVAGTMFIFTACNCGAGDAAATDSIEEVAACADDCQKACCLGCQATDGDPKCKEDHSCCVVNDDVDIEYTEEQIEERNHDHHHDDGHNH